MSLRSSSSEKEKEKEKEEEEETKRARQRKRAQEEPNVPGMNSPPTESTSLENTTEPMAEVTAALAAEAVPPAADPQKDKTAFNKRIEQEYQHAMEKEIKKATQAIKRRYNAMLSQEHNPMDTSVVDALGHNTDYYENLVTAVQSGDKSVGATTEEVYQHLYDLTFTEMRSLSALKQQYSNL